MGYLPIIQLVVTVLAYLFIYIQQKNKTKDLTEAIGHQKSAIEAQTSTVGALKAQADGQAAITTRLEGIVDRTERYATTILSNHEPLIKLVEQRGQREKQELEERAEREKQEMNKQLEEARSQLSSREEVIKEVDIQPALASLLTSLSEESFATREMLTMLRKDIIQELVSSRRPENFDYSQYIQRIASPNYQAHLNRIYEKVISTEASRHDKGISFFKAALESERAYLGPGKPIIINHFIMLSMHMYKIKTGTELIYSDWGKYAEDNQFELGPFIACA
jgi:hypothetical protein